MSHLQEEEKSSHSHNRLILQLMIKNESAIIVRCLSSVLPHMDAVCILDTGSTDDTIERCETYLRTTGKPFAIHVEPFKNFGYNRTVSFQKAQALCESLKWDPDTTYTLAMDADMMFCPSPAFKDFKLTQNGYTMIQENGHLKYYNTRIMKCSYPWKCVGATHEYWSGDPTDKIPREIAYLDDRNDGGCKADKFERDVRLLTEEIQENPLNDRAHYYLGQSLKDLGKFEEAIAMFKKRIELGGWYEERWYAHYQIGMCYKELREELQMEYWMNKAFQVHPHRAEPLYFLTRYFREVSQHYKAYHYYVKGRHIPYPSQDVLFIEDAVYKGLFDYENTILACYVNGKTKQDSLVDIVQYLHRGIPHYVGNVWDNLHYYVESLLSPTYKGEYTKYLFPDKEEYKVSSCSLLPYDSEDPNKRFLLNTRYVNYSIDDQGAYHVRSEPERNVRTKNGFVFLNKDYQPTTSVQMIQEIFRGYSRHIEGIEDVRLFRHEGEICFIGSCANITEEYRIVIVTGSYDLPSQTMKKVSLVEPPRPSSCEKNWVYVPNTISVAQKGRMNFIYGWHPLEIGAVDPETNQLQIHTTYSTSPFFSRFRGSSSLVSYHGKWYAMVHFVRYSTPRVYYHVLVQFNDRLEPERITVPFCFRQLSIEYSLSIDIQSEYLHVIFSEMDTDPGRITVPWKNLRWISV